MPTTIESPSPRDVVQLLSRHRAVLAMRYHAGLLGALGGCETALIGYDDKVEEAVSEAAGTIIGSGIGGLPMIEEQYDKLKDRGPGRVTPFS